jgi:sugar (pentulose or hexulose) kinase
MAFDPAGRVLAAAQEPFTYRLFEHPTLPMVRGCDLDADATWGALAGCTRRVVAALPAGARIRGVAATSQREACVFLDSDGQVLYAGPNLDARAVVEGCVPPRDHGPRAAVHLPGGPVLVVSQAG